MIVTWIRLFGKSMLIELASERLVLELLLKVFLIELSNWIHMLWTLKLISNLDFTLMQQNMIQRAFDIIEDATVSQR